MEAGPSKEVEIRAENGDLNPRQVEIQVKIEMDVRLFKAVITGNVSFLEKIGHLNLEHVTERGNSILHVAAKSGKVQIMEKVLNLQPSLLDKTNGKGNTALHIAASLGYFDMTKLLITFANKVEKKMELLKMQNLEKNTVLHEAIRNCRYDIVELLIREDSSLALLTNNAGESPLFLAVDRGFHKIALHILEAVPECANPECSYGGRKSMNVLHAAVISCTKSEFVQKMLGKFPQAIFEADDDFGWIPLHYAAHVGNVQVVKLFLKRDISIANKKDKEGMSALHISAKEGRVDVMRILIGKCPYTCELLDNKCRTALHLAVESGNRKAVKILFKALAFQDLINEQDEDGNTPLHLAAINGLYPILMTLADDKRVDKWAFNKEGKNIADIIQLDNQFTVYEKEEIMSTWNRHVVLPSSKRVDDSQTTKVQEKREPAEEVKNLSKKEEVKKVSEFHLVAITLITTVTFAVSLQVPGGYNSSGKAVLSENYAFKYFLMCDSLAFGASAGLMIMHLIILMAPSGLFDRVVSPAKRLTIPLIGTSVYLMISAFWWGLKSVLDENSSLTSVINNCISFSFAGPVFLSFLFCLLMISRVLRAIFIWVLRAMTLAFGSPRIEYDDSDSD